MVDRDQQQNKTSHNFIRVGTSVTSMAKQMSYLASPPGALIVLEVFTITAFEDNWFFNQKLLIVVRDYHLFIFIYAFHNLSS